MQIPRWWGNFFGILSGNESWSGGDIPGQRRHQSVAEMSKLRNIKGFNEFLIKDTRLGARKANVFSNDGIQIPAFKFAQTTDNAPGTMLLGSC